MLESRRSPYTTHTNALCIAAKNHCTSMIELLLKKPDGNLQLLTPVKLPLQYAIESTIYYRSQFQSAVNERESAVDGITKQEMYQNLEYHSYEARERIAHDVISLIAMETVNAIQQMLDDSEHATSAHEALAKLLRITDFCFDSIREKIQESLKQCSEIAENLRMIEASTSPVFTSLYDGITQDIAASSAPVATPEDECADECAKDANTPKLILKP